MPSGLTRGVEFSFTTRTNAAIPAKGFAGGVHFIPAMADAPSTAPNAAIANTPYPDSPVIVHHCPGAPNNASDACKGFQNETWLIYPDPIAGGVSQQTSLTLTQVTTLLNQQTTPAVNLGQFSMPFYFTISMKYRGFSSLLPFLPEGYAIQFGVRVVKQLGGSGSASRGAKRGASAWPP